MLKWELGQKKPTCQAEIGYLCEPCVGIAWLGQPSLQHRVLRGARKACQVLEVLADVCLRSCLSVNRSGGRSHNRVLNNKGMKHKNRFFIRQEFASGQLVFH